MHRLNTIVATALALSITAGVASAASDPPAPPSTSKEPTSEKPAAATAEASDDGLGRSLAALTAAERATVTLDLTHTDAKTVLDRLNALGVVPIRADWATLTRIDVDADDPLAYSVKDVSLLDALAILAQSVGSETERAVVDAAPGQLVLTTDMSALALRATAIYDVADIATDATLLGELDAGDAPVAPAASAPTASDESLKERMQRLVDLITQHVDTNTWTENGGERSAVTTEAARLVVTATPSTHRKVRALLMDLRRESPIAAQVGITVYELPQGAVDALTRPPAPDAGELARLIEHRDDARRGWSPRVVVRLGEEATIKSGSDASVDSCKLVARHDRIGRVLSVTLEVKLARGSAHAEFVGTLPFESGRGKVGVVLPAGPDEGRSWAIVVDAAECTRTSG